MVIWFAILVTAVALLIGHYITRNSKEIDKAVQRVSWIAGQLSGLVMFIFHPGSSWIPWRVSWQFVLEIIALSFINALMAMFVAFYATRKRLEKEERMRRRKEDEEFWNSFPPGTYQKWGHLIDHSFKEED